jgi:hypothetical protein
MQKCMSMTKEECAAYCDSVGCTPEEKAVCVKHAGAGKSCCKESSDGHTDGDDHHHAEEKH